MNLLIFVAIPLATILLAIVLQKALNSPILVSITFFAIYLIILFILYATGIITNLAIVLAAIIIYTVIAFVTASIVRLIKIICQRFSCDDNNQCCDNADNGQQECCCNCNENETVQTSIAVSGNIIPNNSNNGRTGIVRGCYRRY